MERICFSVHHVYTTGFELDITFESNHQVTALTGPSGSGKTSALEMIAGIKTPCKGRIVIDNTVLFDSMQGVNIPLHKRRIGMVFQDYLLFPHMTVEKNIVYGRARSTNTANEFQHIVDVLDLGNLLTRYPKNLSGGEKQRAALGRALFCNPQLLLLDEPLSALNDTLKYRILAYLEQIVSEWKIPILLVSHAEREVRRLVDWVFVLTNGRVTTDGAPDTAFSNNLITPVLQNQKKELHTVEPGCNANPCSAMYTLI